MGHRIMFQFVFASAVIGWYILANQTGVLHSNHTVVDAEYAMENCETYFNHMKKAK